MTTDTYYLTKYALSNKGTITKLDACDARISDGYVYIDGPSWWKAGEKIGRHAHTTVEAAIAAAEAARTKRISSLRKQIVALEKLKFTVEEGNG